MPADRIIVVGASAGGVSAVTELVRGLPADLPAAVLVVVHFPPDANSALSSILARQGGLPAVQARDGLAVEPGRVYASRPDFHLSLQDGYIRLLHGPRVNGVRPAVDTLFRSAARAYGRRVVGVVLSGSGDDGTVGLAAIKASHGIAVVQDPAEALFPSMPQSAIDHVEVDSVLPLSEIAPLLTQLAGERGDGVQEESVSKSEIDRSENLVEEEKLEWEQGQQPRDLTTITCPNCGGTLWLLDHDGILEFRCHVGHDFSIESLMQNQSAGVETALWSAVRILQERVMLLRRLSTRASERGSNRSAEHFAEQADDAERHSGAIRSILHSGEPARNEPDKE